MSGRGYAASAPKPAREEDDEDDREDTWAAIVQFCQEEKRRRNRSLVATSDAGWLSANPEMTNEALED